MTPAVTTRRRRGDIGNMAPCILHDPCAGTEGEFLGVPRFLSSSEWKIPAAPSEELRGTEELRATLTRALCFAVSD